MNQNNRFRSRNVENYADQIRRQRIAKQNRNLKNFFQNNDFLVNSSIRSRKRNYNDYTNNNQRNFGNRRRVYLNRPENNYINNQSRVRGFSANPNNRMRMIKLNQRSNSNTNSNSNAKNNGKIRKRQRIGFINRDNRDNQNQNRRRIVYRNYNNFRKNNINNQGLFDHSNQLKRQDKRVTRRNNNPKSQKNKLTIENISIETNNNELAELFTPYGKLLKCSIIYDENNRSTGKGVVEFEKTDSAKLAKNDLQGK
jgi:hypothetical protein